LLFCPPMPAPAPSVFLPVLSLIDLTLEFAERKINWSARAADPAVADAMRVFRRQFADTLVAHLRANASTADFEAACALFADLAAVGADDHPAPTELHDRSMTDVPVSTAALLEIMALVPSWQWANSPRLDDVPLWLLPVYATYRFNRPRLLTIAGQAAASARNFQRACDDLARLARANRGSAAVRAAIAAYQTSPTPPPEWTGDSRGKVLTAQIHLADALAVKQSPEESLLLPRVDRRLRLGVVTHRLAASGALGSLLPAIERLDAQRFELLVFHAQPGDDALGEHLHRRNANIIPLGEDPAQTLRVELLDAAIFTVDPGENPATVTRLARQRVAALQLLHDGLDSPAVWPEIDLYLASTGAATQLPPPPGTRAALLPGAGSITSAEFTPAAPANLNRAQLGLPTDKFIFASLVTIATAPELLDLWAQILARTGDARLLVAFAGDAPPDGDILHRFATYFAAAFARHGVAEERLMIVPLALAAPSARKNFLAMADAVLATGSPTDGPLAFATAEAGVPCVALDHPSVFDHRATVLLRLAGIPELAAPTPGGYVDLAAQIATDRTWRADLQTRWQEAAPRLATTHDSFAQSEALGQLLETAFDAIAVSREQFAATDAPLQLPTPLQADLLIGDAQILLSSGLIPEAEARARQALARQPDSKAVRWVLAKAATARGASLEAADLLLTCVELDPSDADLWHEVAIASVRASRSADAVMALDSALRLDPRRINSWLLLAGLVDQETVRQVADVLRQLAPDDPRVKELLTRTAA
jgi:predicted O-linked N-acetylglucosamine transferase (SPINDLY family)